jgi:hypothetical protein
MIFILGPVIRYEITEQRGDTSAVYFYFKGYSVRVSAGLIIILIESLFNYM